MKILEIKDKGAFFWDLDLNDWKPIDQIGKDDIFKLLDAVIEHDVEMSPFCKEALPNHAHQIIYKSLFEKFEGFIANKNQFRDESDRTYLDEIQKYSSS